MPKYEIGKYEVEITGQGFQEARTGTMQLVLEFSILGRIDPKDPNTLLACAEGSRKFFRAITENTVDWVMEDLKLLGVDALESWAQLDPSAELSNFIDLAGQKLDMACGSKVGADGKSYEDWSIARAGGGGGKPIEHADKKKVNALDRLFGKHLKKAGPAPARQRVPLPADQMTPAMAAMPDDDVPF